MKLGLVGHCNGIGRTVRTWESVDSFNKRKIQRAGRTGRDALTLAGTHTHTSSLSYLYGCVRLCVCVICVRHAAVLYCRHGPCGSHRATCNTTNTHTRDTHTHRSLSLSLSGYLALATGVVCVSCVRCTQVVVHTGLPACLPVCLTLRQSGR